MKTFSFNHPSTHSIYSFSTTFKKQYSIIEKYVLGYNVEMVISLKLASLQMIEITMFHSKVLQYTTALLCMYFGSQESPLHVIVKLHPISTMFYLTVIGWFRSKYVV